jgi:hypothetical protein
MDNIENCCCTKYIKEDTILKLSFANETYSIYGNLNKGEKIILKYFGSLLPSDESKETQIFLNYGYGNLWSEKNVLELKPCYHSDTKCYCTELELLNSENLFFCFMDNNNNWDLNEKSSYMITIDTPTNTLIKQTVAIALPEEEYISETSKLLKKIIAKITNFFEKIGGLFE